MEKPKTLEEAKRETGYDEKKARKEAASDAKNAPPHVDGLPPEENGETHESKEEPVSIRGKEIKR